MTDEIYQDFILELYKNPVNFGKIDGALHAQSYNPLCGDRIEFFIKTDGDRVVEAKFIGSGCAISQASASLLTEEIKGKTVGQLEKMDVKDVLRMIQIDLSRNPSRLKCALLSLETLKKAIKDNDD